MWMGLVRAEYDNAKTTIYGSSPCNDGTEFAWSIWGVADCVSTSASYWRHVQTKIHLKIWPLGPGPPPRPFCTVIHKIGHAEIYHCSKFEVSSYTSSKFKKGVWNFQIWPLEPITPPLGVFCNPSDGTTFTNLAPGPPPHPFVLLTSCPDPYTAASHIQLRAAVRSDQQNYCETSARSLSSTRCRRASISLLFGGAVLRGGVGADITPSIVAWRRASPLAESWCNVWQPVLMP